MPSKRFYCTICGKVKRVRKLPRNTTPSITPEKRIGQCDKHSEPIVETGRFGQKKVASR